MDGDHLEAKGRRLPGQPETAPYLHLLNTAKDTVKAIAIARASIHAAVTDKQPIDWKAWVFDIFEPFDVVDTGDGRSELKHRAGVFQQLRDAMRPVELRRPKSGGFRRGTWLRRSYRGVFGFVLVR